MTLRIGHGYDVHRFALGRKCIIGGVEIPFDMGLLGHSDADLSGGHGRSQRVGVYVWEKGAGWPILVEQHPHLPQKHGMLKRLLEDISERYLKKKDKQNA